MLHANLDLHTDFQESLSDNDKRRLNRDLTALAIAMVSEALLDEPYESLRELLSTGRISPVLFQWALVEREVRSRGNQVAYP
jgi:hypothetical protein